MSAEIISIYILKSSATVLSQAEGFLTNRGWNVASGTSLREAVTYISQNQPKYVLISADHPNKKVSTLPKILNEAFTIQTVGFSEKEGSQSYQQLILLGLEYNLYPPVSGPAIERIVLKIIKDEAQKKAPKLKAEFIVPGGGGTSAEQIKKSYEQARKALTQLVTGADDDDGSPPLTQQGFGPKPTGGVAYRGSLDAAPKNEVRGQKEQAEESLAYQQENKDKPSGNFTYLSNEGSQNPPAANSPQLNVPQRGYKNTTPLDSVLVQSANYALKETLNTYLGPVNIVELVNKATTILVQGSRFRGYLICAAGKNRALDKTLIDSIQAALYSFLRANNEPVIENSSLELEIHEVNFNGLALTEADFFLKSSHLGDEVTMAFFPDSLPELKLENSANETMVKIATEDLKENALLGFDLYLYLPENDKYLLYVSQGKSLNSTQKQRLLDKGISHMHFKKESEDQIQKYQAQNFINEMIDLFKLAQDNKKT